MEFVAREVLDDCRLAHDMMSKETDHDRLRVQWIGALALIRLVGDVLDKVDSRNSEAVKLAIQDQFKTDRNDELYVSFIKGSRDKAVHAYEHDLFDESEIAILAEHSEGSFDICDLKDCLYIPLTGNFRSGEDARDVYAEAIEWWDRHIASIEQRTR